jgi:lipopolysaccharide transport system ATP-binding protein
VHGIAKGLQQQDATILFVSHNMFSIKTMCSRVIYLRGGQIHFDGPTERGIELYEEDCRLTTLPWAETKPEEWQIIITEIALLDESGRARSVFDHGERMKLRLRYDARRRLENPNFIVAFVHSDGIACCNYSSELDGMVIEAANGAGSVDLMTPPLKLVSELYTIHVLVRERGFQQLLCAQIGATFHIRDDLLDTHFGVFHEAAEWSWDGLPNASRRTRPHRLNG